MRSLFVFLRTYSNPHFSNGSLDLRVAQPKHTALQPLRSTLHLLPLASLEAAIGVDPQAIDGAAEHTAVHEAADLVPQELRCRHLRIAKKKLRILPLRSSTVGT
jgi:hypothetical protein